MTHLTFMHIKWRTNPIGVEIWYGKPEDKYFTRQKLEIGDEFHIRVEPGRFCIGSESGKGAWITCKQRQLHDGLDTNSALQFIQTEDEKLKETIETVVTPDNKNYQQCYRCSTTEYFSCRMTCQGDICTPTSQIAEKLCQPPNTSVYLTHVGGNLKIGVSLGIPRRWVEQASDLATVIATAPGLEARRLEQVAAQELDLKLQVRNTSKLQNIPTLNIDTAKEELQQKINEIYPIANRILDDVPGEIIKDPEIIDLSQFYGDLETNQPIQEVNVEEGQEFGGTIVGLKGSLVIVNQDVYRYAIDLKKLQSRQFRFLDEPAKIKTQSYLDQWF